MLSFWKSEPHYAYKRYAYKENMYLIISATFFISGIMWFIVRKVKNVCFKIIFAMN